MTLQQRLCGLRYGHTEVLRYGPRQLVLYCTSCERETPGWKWLAPITQDPILSGLIARNRRQVWKAMASGDPSTIRAATEALTGLVRDVEAYEQDHRHAG